MRALLFHKVTGSRFPVMTNIFGSRPRLMDMIGAHGRLVLPALGRADAQPGASRRRSRRAPNDLEEIKLTDLPQITYFERDGGPLSDRRAYFWRVSRTAAFPTFPSTAHRSSATRSCACGSGARTISRNIRQKPKRAAKRWKPRSCSGRRCRWCSPRRRRSLTTRTKWRSPARSKAARSRCAAADDRSRGAGRHRDRHRGPHPARAAPAGGPVRRIHGLLRAGRRQPRVRGQRRHGAARRAVSRPDLRVAGGPAAAGSRRRNPHLSGAARGEPARASSTSPACRSP